MPPQPSTPLRSTRFAIELPVPIEQAFAYHERPGALQRLLPPWETMQIDYNDASLAPGSRVVLRKSVLGIPLRWHAEHTLYEAPDRFVDIQARGPMRYWRHEHRFESIDDPQRCRLVDDIEYQLPGGPLGRAGGDRYFQRKLAQMFAYRHRTTRDDLQLAARYAQPPMTIAISGASGLVGSRLTHLMTLLGHRVIHLKRGQEPTATVRRDASEREQSERDAKPSVLYPWSDSCEWDSIGTIDAVVHLAGESVAQRWNGRVKASIRDSRITLTEQLCERLAQMNNTPRVLVSASATGFYGDRGSEELNEQSSGGSGFLSDVARDWEHACQSAKEAGMRVVNLRIGLVVTPAGGALKRLLLPAKLGLNGPVSHGHQWWSWIALDDLIGVIYHAIASENLAGPLNAVAPQCVTSGQFAKTLGRVLCRPAFIPTPATPLRWVMGEMVDALLMASAKVRPDVLQQSGYAFRLGDLETCLRHQLGRVKLS